MSTLTSPITPTTVPASSVAGAVDNTEIASNFTTFLQLLTTQLKNQDPLSPMDTNQFTQQLVEFASVEQQMKSNSSLTTLVSLEQAAQSTSALALVGATVVVDGSTTQLSNGKAARGPPTPLRGPRRPPPRPHTPHPPYPRPLPLSPGPQIFVGGGHNDKGANGANGATATTAAGGDARGPPPRRKRGGFGGPGGSGGPLSVPGPNFPLQPGFQRASPPPTRARAH